MKRRIILASTSPRRIDILSKTDLKFEIVAPEYDEEIHLDLTPLELVKYLTQKKAESVVYKYPDAIIISGDTIIALGEKVFGKPKTPERAKVMLTALSGTVHQVLTGFTILDTKNKKIVTEADVSNVYVKPVSEADIDAYIATGEPLDKAAAYAIQGEAHKFIEKIEGDYLSIMGLPLARVIEALKEFGIFTNQRD